MQANFQSKQAEVRRKLNNSGITKASEFEQIIAKLIGQKDRLEQDLRMLRQKVVALHEKQALKMHKERLASKGSRPKLKAKPSINYREELNRKHEQLKIWQKRVLRATKDEKSQVEHREIMNRLASIEHEIGLELQRFSDQKMTYKRLRKALKLFDKQDQKKSYLQDGMQRENKLLKKRVFSLKKIVDTQISKEIDLQSHLIDIRDKQRCIEQLARNAKREQSQLKSSRHTRPIGRHRTQVQSSLESQSDDSEKQDTVSFQMNHNGGNLLKDQIYQLQGYLYRKETKFREDIIRIQKRIKKNYPNQALNMLRQGSKLSFGKELDLVLDHCRKSIHTYADLNRQKIKILLERQKLADDILPQNHNANLRYTSTSIAQGFHKSELSYHSNSRSVKRLAATITPLYEHQSTGRERSKQKQRIIQRQIQAQIQIYGLRRQFIGQINEGRVDDRQLLGSNMNCSIRTLKIYYTDRGIASVQAIYNLNNTGKIINGRLILPPHFIENYCKVHMIQTSNDDFIRYFKVRYSVEQNRITSMRIVTNRNVKNGFGQSKIPKGQQFDDGSRTEKEYVFDIGRDEFASTIFCSHIQKGPYWYLCGFGAQIDDL